MNLNKVCIDASLAVSWLSYERHTVRANALRRYWIEKSVEMVAPALFHAEVVSALRQQVYFKRILPDEGEEAFSIYLDIPLTVIDGPEIYRKAWQLTKDLNQPVCYDMQYLAIAELEDCLLWTSDRKLVNAVRSKTDRVRWIGDFSGK
ncbi:MAG: type II toxin-antitoxin system VapC family toxin [Dehalococcoidales bacterium]|nr:type II toxin-antitoxin system VapC family toxin [Dehalococcoidales bacterium]